MFVKLTYINLISKINTLEHIYNLYIFVIILVGTIGISCKKLNKIIMKLECLESNSFGTWLLEPLYHTCYERDFSSFDKQLKMKKNYIKTVKISRSLMRLL